jgi:hypothetical protein
MLAVAAYAFGRGKVDERLAASICVIASVATVLVSSRPTSYFSNVEIGTLSIDGLALAGFVIVAIRSTRFWPLWVAGFQLTSVFSHFLKAIHWGMIPQVYAAAERFWVYPIFLAIIVATWRGHRRRRQEQQLRTTHA